MTHSSMAPPGPRTWARSDDFGTRTAQVFPRFDTQAVAHRPDEVADVLQHVQDATDRGRWAFGFVAYEAAPGLDPTLPVAGDGGTESARSSLPLVWFGISAEPPRPTTLVARGGNYRTGPWTSQWNQDAYEAAFTRVKDAIAAGRTYQCNLTTALTAPFAGDAQSFYADLAHAQLSRYCAYVDCGSHVIASASPELFFEWGAGQLSTKPMKGTALRRHTDREDSQALHNLLSSAKERAENVIIVDLLRNDLAKIATVGSVRVRALLTPEAYPTVWQLTSHITAQPAPFTSLVDVMRALFPCGSVTGAPKAETMGIIRDLEERRRGIYCGAIGWVAPPTEPVRARFSVAIRTAHVDRSTGTCEYGVGSGITWGSNASAEFDEMLAKSRILANGNAVRERMPATAHAERRRRPSAAKLH
jgi:para-aminobenzoate synthetase / 4-amino-4-deoxychorismate lyase